MKSKMNIKSIVILAIVSIISLFFINMSLAANTGKIAVETANLRETADENSKILELLSINQEVEIVEKIGNWYKVKAEGIVGYLREDLLTVNNTTSNTTTENQAQTNQTQTSSTQANQTQTSSTQPNQTQTSSTQANQTQTSSTQVNQTQTNQSTETNVKSQENNSELGKKYVTENTKLKIVPVINGTDIIEVKKDEEVNVIEIINGWACVETQTTKGWIRKEKLIKPEEKQETQVSQNPEVQNPEAQSTQAIQSQAVNKTLYVKSASVNVRKDSNTTSEIVTTLTVNTAVTVTEELSNGWSKIQVNGKEGYILTSLLSAQKQETSRSQTTPRQSTTQATNSNQAQSTTTANVAPSGRGATVIETAKQYLGYKYVYGGSSPSTGFDCSGFTSYIYKLHGVTLSRTSQAQSKNGVAVSKSDLQPGDLVFFYSGISHVGIYIGGGSFIHASNAERGVRIDTLSSGHYSGSFVCARRVM